MRRITILFIFVVLFLFLRHELARPPRPEALIIPASLRESFFEMERMR